MAGLIDIVSDVSINRMESSTFFPASNKLDASNLTDKNSPNKLTEKVPERLNGLDIQCCYDPFTHMNVAGGLFTRRNFRIRLA